MGGDTNWGAGASGAVTGAAAGSVAGPWGMAAGAVIGGAVGLFGGGGGTAKMTTQQKHFMEQQENMIVAQTELLNMRKRLADDIMKGQLPEAMKGYIDKILVPQTTSTLTAAGLGRSGAIGEATSLATMTAGTNMLGGLLGASPSGGTSGPAMQPMPNTGPDWMSQVGTGLDLASKIGKLYSGGVPGSTPSRAPSPGAGGTAIPSSSIYEF